MKTVSLFVEIYSIFTQNKEISSIYFKHKEAPIRLPSSVIYAQKIQLEAKVVFIPLLTRIYICNANDNILICADCRARIGNLCDIIFECNTIPPREKLDNSLINMVTISLNKEKGNNHKFLKDMVFDKRVPVEEFILLYMINRILNLCRFFTKLLA